MLSLIGSRKLNKVSIPAEALYFRLLLTCDDAGRMPADAETVAAEALGRRIVNGSVKLEDISGWVSELAEVGLIRLYDTNGSDSLVLEITQYRNFRRHKKIRDFGPLLAPLGPGPPPEEEEEVEEEAKQKKKAAPRRRPSGDHQEAIALWMGLWEEARGEPYAFQGGKDGTAVANALKYAGGDLGLLEERMRRLLLDPPGAWYAQNASLSILASKWNELGMTVSRELTPAERSYQEDMERLNRRIEAKESCSKRLQQ